MIRTQILKIRKISAFLLLSGLFFTQGTILFTTSHAQEIKETQGNKEPKNEQKKTPVTSTKTGDKPDVKNSILALTVLNGKKVKARGSAVVVETGGWVLASARIVGKGKIHLLSDNSGFEVKARVIAIDKSLGLALLRAALTEYPAAVFADGPVKSGDTAISVGYWGPKDQRPLLLENRGAIGGIFTKKTKKPLLMHNALFGVGGYGSLLVNNCHQVIGLNRTDPSVTGGIFSSRQPLDAPQIYALAITNKHIQSFLDEAAVKLKLATEGSCQSEASQAEQKARDAEQKAKDAEQKAKEAKEKVEALEKEKKTTEAEKEAAKKAAEEAKKAADEAAAKLKEADDTARETSAKFAEQKRVAEVAATKAEQSQYIMYVGAGFLAIIIIIAFVVVSKNRKKKELAEAGQAEAERLMSAPAGANDLLLEGQADDGSSYILKIPAASLHPENGGAIIGRSPESAEFVINRPKISRQHCRLFVESGQLLIEDLGSTNGTLVNDNRVGNETCPLLQGDTILVGDVSMTLERA